MEQQSFSDQPPRKTQQYSAHRHHHHHHQQHLQQQQPVGENPAEIIFTMEEADFECPMKGDKDDVKRTSNSPTKPSSQKSYRSQQTSSSGNNSVSGSNYSDGDDDGSEISNAMASLGLSKPTSFRSKSKSSESTAKERSIRRLPATRNEASSSSGNKNNKRNNSNINSSPQSPEMNMNHQSSFRQKRKSKSFVMEHGGGGGGGDDAASVSSNMRRRRTRSITRGRSTSPGRQQQQQQQQRHRSKSRDTNSSTRRQPSMLSTTRRDIASVSPGRRQRPTVSSSSTGSVGAPAPRRQRSLVHAANRTNNATASNTSHSRPSSMANANSTSTIHNNNHNNSHRSSRTLGTRTAERNRVKSKAAIEKEMDGGRNSPEETAAAAAATTTTTRSNRPAPPRRHRSLSNDAGRRRSTRSRSQDAATTRSNTKNAGPPSPKVKSSVNACNNTTSRSSSHRARTHHSRSPGTSRRNRVGRRTVSGTNTQTATSTKTASATPSSVHSRKTMDFPSPPLTKTNNHKTHNASRSHHVHGSTPMEDKPPPSSFPPPPPPHSPEEEYDFESSVDMMVNSEDEVVVEEDGMSMADTIQSGYVEPRRLPTRSRSSSAIEMASIASNTNDLAKSSLALVSDPAGGGPSEELSRRLSKRNTDVGTSPQPRPKLRGRRSRPETKSGGGETRKSASMPNSDTTTTTTTSSQKMHSSPTKSLSSPHHRASPTKKMAAESPSTSSQSSQRRTKKEEEEARLPSLEGLFASAPDFGVVEASPSSLAKPKEEEGDSASLGNLFASAPEFRLEDLDIQQGEQEEPIKVEKPPSLEELFASAIDEQDDEQTIGDDSTTEEEKKQKSLEELFASQQQRFPSYMDRGSASLSDLFASAPNFSADSLPDPSVCSSPAASSTAERMIVWSKSSSAGFSPAGGKSNVAAPASGNRLGHHFHNLMNRSFGNFAQLLADSSVGSSDNKSDVASLGSHDLSSTGGNTPKPLRRGLKKSRSFGDVSQFTGTNDSSIPMFAQTGMRRGRKPVQAAITAKPVSMRSTKTHSEDDLDPSGNNNAHVPDAAAKIVGMPEAVVAATTAAMDGTVRVIRTTHTGRTTTASPLDEDAMVVNGGGAKTDKHSAHSASNSDDDEDDDDDDDRQMEQEYLQLCLPSSTNTMTTVGTAMTDASNASPLPDDRASPVAAADHFEQPGSAAAASAAAAAAPSTTVGGIFQRFANRSGTASNGNTPRTNTATRKTLLRPIRGPRGMMRKEMLDDEGAK